MIAKLCPNSSARAAKEINTNRKKAKVELSLSLSHTHTHTLHKNTLHTELLVYYIKSKERFVLCIPSFTTPTTNEALLICFNDVSVTIAYKNVGSIHFIADLSPE